MSEYWIEHIIMTLLYMKFVFSARMFLRVFQWLLLIVLVVFDALDQMLAPCILENILNRPFVCKFETMAIASFIFTLFIYTYILHDSYTSLPYLTWYLLIYKHICSGLFSISQISHDRMVSITGHTIFMYKNFGILIQMIKNHWKSSFEVTTLLFISVCIRDHFIHKDS